MVFRVPSRRSRSYNGTPLLPRSLFGFILQASGWHQFWLALLSSAGFLLNIAPLELQRRIVDEALAGGAYRPVLLLALAYLGLALTEGLLKLLTNTYSAWVGESTIRLLREKAYRHLRDQPDAAHRGEADGVNLSMMIAESDEIGGFVGTSFSEPLLQGGILISVFGYMAFMQPMMALLCLAVFAPQLVIVPIMQAAINRRVAKRIVILRQVSIAIVTSAEAGAAEAQRGRFDQVFLLNVGIFKLKFSMNFLMNLLFHTGVTCVLGLGGFYVIRGEIEVGTVVAFLAGLNRINDPWGALVDWFRNLTVTRAKYRLIAGALASTPATGPFIGPAPDPGNP